MPDLFISRDRALEIVGRLGTAEAKQQLENLPMYRPRGSITKTLMNQEEAAFWEAVDWDEKSR